MTRKTRPFSELRQEQLLIPEVASEYLNLAKDQSQEIFLKALRRVAQARQMSTVAREAGVQRETLYHAFSGEGNPTIGTLSSVLDVLGLDFTVSPKKKPTTSDPNTKGRAQRLHDLIDSTTSKQVGVVNIGVYKSSAGIGQDNRKVVRERDLGGNDFFLDSRSLGASSASLPKNYEQQQLEMVNAL